jgi:hypothetical protein
VTGSGNEGNTAGNFNGRTVYPEISEIAVEDFFGMMGDSCDAGSWCSLLFCGVVKRSLENKNYLERNFCRCDGVPL